MEQPTLDDMEHDVPKQEPALDVLPTLMAQDAGGTAQQHAQMGSPGEPQHKRQKMGDQGEPGRTAPATPGDKRTASEVFTSPGASSTLTAWTPDSTRSEDSAAAGPSGVAAPKLKRRKKNKDEPAGPKKAYS